MDLSEEGLCFLSIYDFPTDEKFLLRINLPGDIPYSAVGKVVWKEKTASVSTSGIETSAFDDWILGKYLYGAKIEEVSASNKNNLKRFFAGKIGRKYKKNPFLIPSGIILLSFLIYLLFPVLKQLPIPYHAALIGICFIGLIYFLFKK